MTKEEKIKEVYGLQFQKVQFDICTDGWVHTGHFDVTPKLISAFDNFNGDKQFKKDLRNNDYNLWRPKSLQGIEDNNGWIKIKSEDDLPKKLGLKCIFLNIHGNTTYISDDVLYDPKWFNQKYTHWRIKQEIKDPVF